VDEELKIDRTIRAATNLKAVRFVDSLRLDQARRREQKGDDVTSAHTRLWEQVQCVGLARSRPRSVGAARAVNGVGATTS
jgi:hypothetical protein